MSLSMPTPAVYVKLLLGHYTRASTRIRVILPRANHTAAAKQIKPPTIAKAEPHRLAIEGDGEGSSLVVPPATFDVSSAIVQTALL